jgi:hypothetical protein
MLGAMPLKEYQRDTRLELACVVGACAEVEVVVRVSCDDSSVCKEEWQPTGGGPCCGLVTALISTEARDRSQAAAQEARGRSQAADQEVMGSITGGSSGSDGVDHRRQLRR